MFQRCIEIQRGHFGNKTLTVGTALNSIGSVYQARGQLKEALELCTEALDIQYDVLGEEHDHVANTLGNMGALYVQLDDPDKALEMFQAVIAITCRNSAGDGNEVTCGSLVNMGQIYGARGLFEEAQVKFEKALVISRRVNGEKHPNVGNALMCLACNHRRQGRVEEALEMHKKALKIYRRALGKDHVRVATSLGGIGSVYSDQGRHDDALECFEKALGIFTRTIGIQSVEAAACLSNIAGSRFLGSRA